MERRDQTATNCVNGLLSHQFASITDVLFKASQRRNQELQQRLLRPVPTPSTFKPANEPPVGAETELSQGDDSGDDRIKLEQAGLSNKNTIGDGLTVVASTKESLAMPEAPPDCMDNPKMMLAELRSSKEKRAGSGVEEELCDNDELAHILIDMKTSWSSLQGTAVVGDNVPISIPTELGIDKEDELSALAKRLGIDSNESEAFEDAKSTLDDLHEQEQVSDTGHSEDEDDDLETLRGKLATMFPPSCDMASRDFSPIAKNTSVVDMTSNTRQHAATKLEPDCTLSTVALGFEAGDVEREDVESWCAQPFSDGMDEQEAKKHMLTRENKKLEATIKYVLEEEKRYRAIEETKCLPARLIVSNLAADVDDAAIRVFFAEYKTEIRNVTILSKRDPVKRTRTAYVDMYSRETAVRASYEVGGIFGLIVKIKLAVE